MQKKYLKKVVTGLSIASLVAGMTGAVMAASGWGGKKVTTPAPSGWSGGQKGAVSTQEETKEAAPGYGAPAAAGYGAQAPAEGEEGKQEGAPGYGTPAPAPGYGK